MVNSLSNIIWILSYPEVHPIYQTFPMQNQKKKQTIHSEFKY